MIYRRLRASRLAPLLLLLLSPALGGWAGAVLHPCPVDSPWLADSAHGTPAGSADQHHGTAQHGSPADADTHQGPCSCPGSCSPGSIAAPVAAAGHRLIQSDLAAGPIPGSARDFNVIPWPPYRLPPATAPPLA